MYFNLQDDLLAKKCYESGQGTSSCCVLLFGSVGYLGGHLEIFRSLPLTSGWLQNVELYNGGMGAAVTAAMAGGIIIIRIVCSGI